MHLKKAETTCFVMFLSGDKKKQPFLDSFKMLKKKALYFTCLLFMFFLCVKTFYNKKYGNSPDTLIYNTTTNFQKYQQKTFFPMCNYWYNFFRWIFILCDNWKTFFLKKKAYRYPTVFLNHHIVAFFENSILKEVRILCYPQNNSATFKFKIKLSSHITHLYK